MPDPQITVPEFEPGFQYYNQYAMNPFTGGRMPYGIGSILMQLFGMKMWPLASPGTTQTQYDAIWQRMRDIEMAQLGRKTLASSWPFQNLGGLNENSILTQIATSLMSQPDGLIATLASPVLGGNPIQANMSSFANLQGMTAGALGRPGGLGMQDILSADEMFRGGFYVHDTRQINKKLLEQHRNEIVGKLQGATGLTDVAKNVLGITQDEIGGMFDQANNSLLPGSTGYTKIHNVNKVIQKLDEELSQGDITQQKIERLRKIISTGDMEETPQKAIGAALEKTLPDISKNFEESLNELKKTKEYAGLEGETPTKKTVQDIIQGAVELKKGGRDMNDLYQLLATKGISLDEGTRNKIGQLFKDADTVTGNKLAGKLDELTKAKDISGVATGLSVVGNIMHDQSIVRGVDFERTMGIKYEDLIGARNELIKDRLFKSKDLGEISGVVAGLYTKPGETSLPEVLDAARGYFGNNLSGKELGQALNQFIGYSSSDMMNPVDRARLEDTLRTSKATARTLNINQDVLKNLTEQAVGMAQANPFTSHLGGMEISPMISQAALNVGALTTTLTGPEVRFLGGPTQMLANMVQGNIESAQHPFATELAAVYTKFKNENNTAGMEAIRDYVTNPNADTSTLGYNNFFAKLAGRGYANENVASLRNWARYQPVATALGFQAFPEIQNVGQRARLGDYMLSLSAAYGGLRNEKGQSVIEQFQEAVKAPDFNVLNLLSNETFTRGQLGTQLQGVVSTQAFMNYLTDKNSPGYNPTAAKNLEIYQSAIESSKKLERRVDKDMAAMGTSTMTRLVSAVASGDLTGYKGIRALGKVFGITDATQQFGNAIKATEAIHRLMSANTVGDMALAMDTYKPESAKAMQGLSDLSKKYNVPINDSTDIEKIVESNGSITSLHTLFPKANITDQKDATAMFNYAKTIYNEKAFNTESAGALNTLSKASDVIGEITHDNIEALAKVGQGPNIKENMKKIGFANPSEIDKMSEADIKTISQAAQTVFKNKPLYERVGSYNKETFRSERQKEMVGEFIDSITAPYIEKLDQNVVDSLTEETKMTFPKEDVTGAKYMKDTNAWAQDALKLAQQDPKHFAENLMAIRGSAGDIFEEHDTGTKDKDANPIYTYTLKPEAAEISEAATGTPGYTIDKKTGERVYTTFNKEDIGKIAHDITARATDNMLNPALSGIEGEKKWAEETKDQVTGANDMPTLLKNIWKTLQDIVTNGKALPPAIDKLTAQIAQ